MIKITPKQLELLKVIERMICDGASPSIQDLSNETGAQTSLVHRRLQALESKRYIRRKYNKTRSITLLRNS